MKEYKINRKLIFTYFYNQFFMIVIMIAFFILQTIGLIDVDLLLILLFLLFGSIFSAPNIYYFLNHYKAFRGSILTYKQSSQSFTLTSQSQIIVFTKDDVLGINQYFTTSSKLPGYGIYVWELLMERGNIKIASILMSNDDFLEIFANITIIDKPNGKLSL